MILFDILICPDCKVDLKGEAGFLFCEKCKFNYRIYKGVVNLKKRELFSGEDDLLKELSNKFDKLNFSEFVEYCDNQRMKDVLPWEFRRSSRLASLNAIEKRQYYSKYEENVIRRIGSHQLSITLSILEKMGKVLDINKVLDIGTGRDSWAVAASNIFPSIIGLDIDMVSLLIAKKYCAEREINNVLFVGGLAEKLPFKDCTFDLLNCQSNLEHFPSQLESMQEMGRVLSPGGYCLIDSPNRFNVFSPESHTSIRFLGFLPRRVAHLLSIRIKGRPFEDIRLLSYFTIRKFGNSVFKDNHEILSVLDVRGSEKNKIVGRIPLAKHILKLVGSYHYLVARKI